MKKGNVSIKKLIKILLQILLYAVVIYFIFDRVQSTDNIWENISNIDLFYAGVAVVIFALQTLFNAYLWNYLMQASGEKVTLNGQMDVYLKSYLLRYIPGNVVGILSRGEFNRKYGISRIKSLWGWFFENITYLAIGASIGSYFVFKNLAEVTIVANDYTHRSDLVMISGVAFLVIVIAASLLLMFKSNWMWNLFHEVIVKKLMRKNLGKTIDVKLNNNSRFLIVLGYLVSWGLYSVSFLFLAFSVVPSTIDYPFAIASINALAWTLGYVFIITPSGTGVREAVFLSLLAMLPGVSPANSAIIAIGMRLVTILGEVGAFIIFKGYNLLNKLNNRLD